MHYSGLFVTTQITSTCPVQQIPFALQIVQLHTAKKDDLNILLTGPYIETYINRPITPNIVQDIAKKVWYIVNMLCL